jgi:hypothetical protein
MVEINEYKIERHQFEIDIKLTKATGLYTVVIIVNRDSAMILKEFSSRSPFSEIRDYATSCRIKRC